MVQNAYGMSNNAACECWRCTPVRVHATARHAFAWPGISSNIPAAQPAGRPRPQQLQYQQWLLLEHPIQKILKHLHRYVVSTISLRFSLKQRDASGSIVQRRNLHRHSSLFLLSRCLHYMYISLHYSGRGVHTTVTPLGHTPAGTDSRGRMSGESGSTGAVLSASLGAVGPPPVDLIGSGAGIWFTGLGEPGGVSGVTGHGGEGQPEGDPVGACGSGSEGLSMGLPSWST